MSIQSQLPVISHGLPKNTMPALVDVPDRKAWRHQPSFVGVLFANEALLCRMLSFLGSEALCRVCSVSRHLHWTIQNMSNSLTIPDLQDLVRRATAPYGQHEPMPVAIRSARRVAAVELIENHKLGFQASNGRALWPRFVQLTREVARVIRKHDKDEPDHGVRFTLEHHLNERLLWLCIYLRLCSDHIFTEWLLKLKDLAYLAKMEVFFTPEFTWTRLPIACQKHFRIHEEQPEGRRPSTEPSPTTSPVARTLGVQKLPNMTLASSVVADVTRVFAANGVIGPPNPSSSSSISTPSSLTSSAERRETPKSQERVDVAYSSQKEVVEESKFDNCVYCHPLAFLTQRCVFDVMHILQRCGQLTARGLPEQIPLLVSIIYYANAFLPHLQSSGETRVVRLLILHMLRKVRSRYCAPSQKPASNPTGPPPSTRHGHDADHSAPFREGHSQSHLATPTARAKPAMDPKHGGGSGVTPRHSPHPMEQEGQLSARAPNPSFQPSLARVPSGTSLSAQPDSASPIPGQPHPQLHFDEGQPTPIHSHSHSNSKPSSSPPSSPITRMASLHSPPLRKQKSYPPIHPHPASSSRPSSPYQSPSPPMPMPMPMDNPRNAPGPGSDSSRASRHARTLSQPHAAQRLPAIDAKTQNMLYHQQCSVKVEEGEKRGGAVTRPHEAALAHPPICPLPFSPPRPVCSILSHLKHGHRKEPAATSPAGNFSSSSSVPSLSAMQSRHPLSASLPEMPISSFSSTRQDSLTQPDNSTSGLSSSDEGSSSESDEEDHTPFKGSFISPSPSPAGVVRDSDGVVRDSAAILPAMLAPAPPTENMPLEGVPGAAPSKHTQSFLSSTTSPLEGVPAAASSKHTQSFLSSTTPPAANNEGGVRLLNARRLPEIDQDSVSTTSSSSSSFTPSQRPPPLELPIHSNRVQAVPQEIALDPLGPEVPLQHFGQKEGIVNVGEQLPSPMPYPQPQLPPHPHPAYAVDLSSQLRTPANTNAKGEPLSTPLRSLDAPPLRSLDVSSQPSSSVPSPSVSGENPFYIGAIAPSYGVPSPGQFVNLTPRLSQTPNAQERRPSTESWPGTPIHSVPPSPLAQRTPYQYPYPYQYQPPGTPSYSHPPGAQSLMQVNSQHPSYHQPPPKDSYPLLAPILHSPASNASSVSAGPHAPATHANVTPNVRHPHPHQPGHGMYSRLHPGHSLDATHAHPSPPVPHLLPPPTKHHHLGVPPSDQRLSRSSRDRGHSHSPQSSRSSSPSLHPSRAPSPTHPSNSHSRGLSPTLSARHPSSSSHGLNMAPLPAPLPSPAHESAVIPAQQLYRHTEAPTCLDLLRAVMACPALISDEVILNEVISIQHDLRAEQKKRSARPRKPLVSKTSLMRFVDNAESDSEADDYLSSGSAYVIDL